LIFLDWSNPEEMFGLLIDYVADERSDTRDPARRAFLSKLHGDLSDLADRFEAMPPEERILRMRALHAERSAEAGDPVLAHLSDCIEELERLQAET
jgi:hypothetical protein